MLARCVGTHAWRFQFPDDLTALIGEAPRFLSERERERALGTSRPSFRSSSCILGAAHRGFAAAIFVTMVVIPVLTAVGSRGPAERAGPVLAEAAPLPPQNGRRGLAKRRPVAVLLCWWRKAKFSRARWRWPWQRNGRGRSA